MQSIEKEIKSLHFSITTDGLGDVVSVEGLGVKSVTHAANDYTITLEDKYSSFRGLNAISGISSDYHLVSEAVNGNKQIVVQSNVTQASTVIHVVIFLKNTNIK